MKVVGMNGGIGGPPLLRVVAVALLVGCAGVDCVAMPCPLPLAIQLSVTAAASGAALDATVGVRAPIETTLICSRTCSIPGPPGTYQIDVSATGYTMQHQTIKVGGTAAPRCGCASVDMKIVSVALVASSD